MISLIFRRFLAALPVLLVVITVTFFMVHSAPGGPFDADKAVSKEVLEQLKIFENNGYGHLPVCIAKTQFSFSTDPKLKGAPSNHEIPIREVKLSSGAEFIVAVCGSIMTMPGLPRVPAADNIRLNKNGKIEGLF